MNADLNDKIALVTGATEGIGAAITEQLVKEGMRVICIARHQENLAALAEKYGTRVHTIALDVADAAAIAALPERIPEGWRDVYALINNAGITGPAKPLAEMSAEEVTRVFAVNVVGGTQLYKAFLPTLRANHGHIVNVGSVADDVVYAGGAPYTASKAALLSMTNSMRAENITHGVRVGLIRCGHTDTEIQKKRFPDEPEKAEIANNVPYKLQPSDVAGAVAFMLHQGPEVAVDTLTINPTQSTFTRGGQHTVLDNLIAL